ncbi:hypothetical protein MATL_G00002370 [Megalops atlanticus]|uniref:AIG1-type G domain-containing protein n=1 Tax=Megalops atlanticus TaxID=7932 RepID=A0A9D3QEK8_MEGAT|nr:hypothetical protein MATL_G00002370 [Megalops atlanticus]
MAAAKTEMLLPALPISDPLSFPHPPMNNYPKLEETILINSAGTPFLIVSAPEGTSFGTGEAGDQYDLLTGVAGGGEEETEKRPFRRRNSKEGLPPNLSAELTVVVIGSTDTVAYGPGNILLGREKMLQETGQLSQAAAVRKREVAGCCISVVDMVGVLDSELPQEEAERWVQHCVYGCEQGIHAFLLAVPLGGLTDQERRGAEWIQRAFGERALGFTVVLLIYHDEEKKELELMKNRDVQRLVEMCGGRYQTCCRSISSQTDKKKELQEVLVRLEEEKQEREEEMVRLGHIISDEPCTSLKS